MFAAVTRRTGRTTFVELERSHNDGNKLFMSSPPMCELTQEQAADFLTVFETMCEKVWPSCETLAADTTNSD